MNKKYLKITASALILALTVSLSGCLSSEKESVEWDSQADTVSSVLHSSGSSERTDVEGRTEIENISKEGGTDLKGQTVTIGYYTTSNSDGGKPSPSSATYKNELKLISDIESKFNCKLEYREFGGDATNYYREWTAAAQAGVKFADIIQMSTGILYPTHMTNGYLVQLDKYLDMNSTIYNQNAIKKTAVNSAHYMTIMSNRMYVAKGLFFNKSIFSSFNQQTPDTYVQKNEWTWDKFKELAKATTGTKNGVKYYGYGFQGTEIAAWAMSNGGKKVVNENGKYVFNMNSPKYIKGIEMLYNLYNTDKVSTGVKEAKSLWNSGNVAMYVALPGYGAQYMENLGSSNVGFTYMPKGPDVSDYNVSVEETTAWAIPSTVSNPQPIASIMYDLTYPYKWRPTLEQQQEKNFGDSASLKAAMDIGVKGNNNIDIMPIYSYINTVEKSGFGITAQTSPQAYVASVEKAAQDAVNEVWGQK